MRWNHKEVEPGLVPGLGGAQAFFVVMYYLQSWVSYYEEKWLDDMQLKTNHLYHRNTVTGLCDYFSHGTKTSIDQSILHINISGKHHSCTNCNLQCVNKITFLS
ncbi:hypothetical protein SRHO_G00179480 [Serrasalmus rhombeus]